MGRLSGMDHLGSGILGMARYFSAYMFSIASFLFLWGCASPETPAVVLDEEVMLFLKPGLRPESLLFPEYLLIEDLELDTHGRIPESPLVGAGLKTKLGFKTVLDRYHAILESKGWQIAPAEVTNQAFRLLASRLGETLEIRAVQGTDLTQVFILYRPTPPPVVR